MKKLLIVVSLLCIAVMGCAGANITSQLRQSNLTGSNIQTRCERLDMRNPSELTQVFERYDGWQVLYISEFTTPNIVGVNAVVCFQRASK
jgi:hypothetical protein